MSRSQSHCRRVDHVFVGVDGVTDAPERVFGVLTETLGLPAVLPLIRTASMATCLVSLGNIGIEVFGIPHEGEAGLPGWTEWGRTRRRNGFSRLRIEGIALDAAEASVTIPELDRRGLRHSPEIAVPFGFTNVLVPELLGDEGMVFLIAYGDDPRFRNRYADWAAALSKVGGGHLGVVDVAEIVVGPSAANADRGAWQRLLAPLEPMAPNLWRFDAGPDLRLLEQVDGRLAAMTLRIRDLDSATGWLDSKHLVSERGTHQILIDPDGVGGLAIRLIAA